MKCSILIFKKHQQTFQYSIAFKMMKTMFNTHKIIIKYEHVVCFNKKNKIKTFEFQNQSEQDVCCNPS